MCHALDEREGGRYKARGVHKQATRECMQHRMSEITIVPYTNTQSSHDDREAPACVSSIQTATGFSRGYKVKRVLQHHDYKPKQNRWYGAQGSRTQHETAILLRAVFITITALSLVLILLWFVSSTRTDDLDDQ